jgi:hypothetical protein
MPVKARRAKRRIGDAAEAMAWRMVFLSGFDYLRELRPFGLVDHDAVRSALPSAWDRFGTDFLRRTLAAPSLGRVPFALAVHGWPKGSPASLKTIWHDRQVLETSGQ